MRSICFLFLILASFNVVAQTTDTIGATVARKSDTLGATAAPKIDTLAAVTVQSRTPMIEVQPDKVVVNVRNSINATGSTALELLRKSPGVQVDLNDNITLLGTGAGIYIDGKPSPLTGKDLTAFLASMQSNDVDRIELIKNPSAKYDAAGTGGIINIRLRKNSSYGLNGSVNQSYGIGIYSKYNTGLSLNYRNKKFNAFGNYSFNKGINQSWINLYRRQQDSIYDQRSVTVNDGTGHNAKAGIDYFLNPRNTFGLMVTVFTNADKSATQAVTPISPVASTPIRELNAITDGHFHKTNWNLNLNHHFTGKGGRELNTDADLGWYNSFQDNHQANTYVATGSTEPQEQKDYRIISSRRILLSTFKSDYEQPFHGGTLSAGFKTAYVQTSNGFGFSNLQGASELRDTARSNQFSLRENINALYVNYQKTVKKWNIQGGLRMEQTNTRGILAQAVSKEQGDIKRHYLNLFPSFGASYTLDKNNGLNLNYSRRVERPNYQSLNPFESKLDELTYSKGNPYLKPEYTNSISLTHSYKYKLNTTLGFTRTTDFSTSITDTIEGKRNFIQQRNAGTQQNIYLNVSLPFAIFKWWNVYANAGASRLSNRVDLGPGKRSNLSVLSYNFYNQHTITLPYALKLEVSGFYNAPTIWGGTFHNHSFWGMDAGVQRGLLKGKATVKLAVSDVFKSMHWRGVSDFGGLYMDASGGWESRQFKVNFAYRFGRKEIKGSRNRETGLEGLKERL